MDEVANEVTEEPRIGSDDMTSNNDLLDTEVALTAETDASHSNDRDSGTDVGNENCDIRVDTHQIYSLFELSFQTLPLSRFRPFLHSISSKLDAKDGQIAQ